MTLGTVKPVKIEEEMRSSYLDYAMSVIVSRALPDVRDGLKPVHRRILYAMNDMGLNHSSPHKKSARIVGEVLGKYHPHGDASVYDAMVRMAQDFSMRYKLVDGQGNYGSVDNDPPAAMRYTEARLARVAEEMLVDIDKDTVGFMPNFDDSLKEPSVLPGRQRIVITELPYQTNKAALIETIANLVKDKKIGGISELRDESDRNGMRIVIELKKEVYPEQLLNNLYKHTAMQSAFFANMLALVDGQPRVISLKEALQNYIDFRHEVITRRSRFELKEAKARAHILEGLKIALDNIDRVIATIRKSETAEAARQNLMAGFGLSQTQAQAILDMQLRRLANLERSKILEEYAAVVKKIAYLEDLLANPRRMLLLIKGEVDELKPKYGDERKTQIVEQGVMEFGAEDLIPHRRMVVTLSSRGYVKRVPAHAYTAHHRGGKGVIGMVTREEDAVKLLTVADTHDSLFFFTNRGKVFCLKCHEIPSDSSRVAKGTAVINLFPVTEREKVTAMVDVADFVPDTYMLMATCQGEIKKTAVDKFAAVRSSGLIAMDLAEGDELVAACLATDQDDIIFATQQGQSIKFAVSSLRASSRTSGGVRAMRLLSGDRVVSMDKADVKACLLVVTGGGLGKLTQIGQYPRQKRAGSGVRTFKIVEKTGKVVAAKVVYPSEQVMIISADGIVTRTPVKEKDPRQGITLQGRSTQGVRLMRLSQGDKVVGIASFEVKKEKAESKPEGKGK